MKYVINDHVCVIILLLVNWSNIKYIASNLKSFTISENKFYKIRNNYSFLLHGILPKVVLIYTDNKEHLKKQK